MPSLRALYIVFFFFFLDFYFIPIPREISGKLQDFYSCLAKVTLWILQCEYACSHTELLRTVSHVFWVLWQREIDKK